MAWWSKANHNHKVPHKCATEGATMFLIQNACLNTDFTAYITT